ncbi:MAG: hypothetical protein GX672_03755, partial [Synergistaceae bacterium]|nr:hypothetical protein [Synergistaceae bacterium]
DDTAAAAVGAKEAQNIINKKQKQDARINTEMSVELFFVFMIRSPL